LDDFEFSDGSGPAYHDIHKAIVEIARELWSLEENAERLASGLDETMANRV